MAFAWVLIPIVAILAGAWSEWLKFKEKQTQIGTSTSEIERALEKMTEQNANLIRRVQNLEAIVTSQTWDDVQSDRLSSQEDHSVTENTLLPETTHHQQIDLDLNDSAMDNDSDTDEVARLARQLRS